MTSWTLYRPSPLDSVLTSIDSILTVIKENHLSWRVDEDGTSLPNYKSRLNRQLLPSYYKETGGVMCSKVSSIKRNSRIGSTVELFEVSYLESIDIDNNEQWLMAESLYHMKYFMV